MHFLTRDDGGDRGVVDGVEHAPADHLRGRRRLARVHHPRDLDEAVGARRVRVDRVAAGEVELVRGRGEGDGLLVGDGTVAWGSSERKVTPDSGEESVSSRIHEVERES